MDLSRHIEIFNPDMLQHPIHIIGAGATGSFVGMMLARMGCPSIMVYDFDTVEIHNIPNQYYDTTDLGRPKVDCLGDKLRLINPNINIGTINRKVVAEREEGNDEVVGIDELEGYVFLLVDSMAVRKELWEAIKKNERIIHCWESRLGSDQARVYSLERPSQMKEEETSKYEEDFYDDDVAEASACGTSITVLPVVLQTAALMITQFIELVMEKEYVYYYKTIFDNHYNKFEESFEIPTIVEEDEVPTVEEDMF